MICDRCGLPLLGTETFCPQCGAAIKKEQEPTWLGPGAPSEGMPVAGTAEPEPEVIEVDSVPILATPAAEAVAPSLRAAEPRGAPGGRRAARKPKPQAPARPGVRSRLVGPMGLGMLAGVVVFIIAGLAILGVAQGLRLRGAKQAESAKSYYDQGMAYLGQGNYELAIGAFEYALRLRPDYPEAQKKLDEARAKAEGQPTPTIEGAQVEPSTLLSQGRAAYDRGAWAEAIQKLEALQAADATYEQTTVRRLLVSAYTNDGLKLANDGSLEEAIRRFDQALALQPDNPDVQAQRRLATLYQAGMSAWEADWPEAIQSFAALYALQPGYKDTAQRLQRAYVLAADAAGAQTKWCDAVEYYKLALDMASTPEVAAKRDEAARLCASPNASGTAVPSGTLVGIFAGEEPTNSDWGKVHGTVLDAKGKPVGGVKVKVAAYDWSATTNTDGNGYYVFEMLSPNITFTISLVDLPMQPVDVKVKPYVGSRANFVEKK